jgi:hypothetical protein
MPDSNRRPLPCEGSALPTAPIARATTILPYGRQPVAPPSRPSGPRVTVWSAPSRSDRVIRRSRTAAMRMWRSGSASPCQGEGREFESRHPLEWKVSRPRNLRVSGRTPGGVAERLGSGLQSRPHGFESRRHLTHWAIGAAVARFPDTEEVTGSIPVSPTRKAPLRRGFFVFEASGHGADSWALRPCGGAAPRCPVRAPRPGARRARSRDSP